jgi:hypothetical protein
MDNPKSTPPDFFLWAGAMVSLYWSVTSFITLLFAYIDHAFPDTALDQYSYYDPYQGGVAYAMASLIVLAPVFLILMRTIRRGIAADQSRANIWVRRWALYLTVFVAAVTIIIDLIVLLFSFLSGAELTVAFLLKAIVVLLVAAAGFMHFLADIWGYWFKFPNYARYINWATGALVVLTVLAGFVIIGSPRTQREYRLDEQRVNDLMSLQYQVMNYYQQKGTLPVSIEDLKDPISSYHFPVDPETKQPYEYRATGVTSFELCADFSAPTIDRRNGSSIARPSMYGGISENWQHSGGRTCFERPFDPELYPLYPKGR